MRKQSRNFDTKVHTTGHIVQTWCCQFTPFNRPDACGEERAAASFLGNIGAEGGSLFPMCTEPDTCSRQPNIAAERFVAVRGTTSLIHCMRTSVTPVVPAS